VKVQTTPVAVSMVLLSAHHRAAAYANRRPPSSRSRKARWVRLAITGQYLAIRAKFDVGLGFCLTCDGFHSQLFFG
jgi:hypothetical protein